MDHAAFDHIARLVGGLTSRRAALKSLAAAAAARAVPDAPAAAKEARRPQDAKEAGDGRRDRKPIPEGPCGDGSHKANICKRNGDCCTGFCKKRGVKQRGKAGVCRCIRRGRPCTEKRNCCGTADCTNGVCGGRAPLVATGQPCSQADSCQDQHATCTTYTWNAAKGTYCLLPMRSVCSVDQDCASQRCMKGVCAPCSDPACVTPCTPMVCPRCTYTTVQAAINAAKAGDVVDIGTGTYVEDLTYSKNLTLRACPGERVTLRNATSNATAASAKRTITGSLNASLTIIDIVVDGDSAYCDSIYGGGISSDGSVKLAGTTRVQNGYSADGGGGVKVVGNGLTLMVTDDAAVNGNSTDTYGGGLLLDGQSDLVIAESARITDNNSDSYGGGAAIRNGPNATVSGLALIDHNRSVAGGGGLCLLNWDTPRPFTVTISDDVVISNNTAGSDGGGIQIYTDDAPTFQAATLFIRDRVAITGNSTAATGGGLYAWRMNIEISDSVIIANNSAAGDGGGVAAGTGEKGPDRTITVGGSVSITGNAAARGAGASITGAEIILKDSAALASNTASGDGGGAFLIYRGPREARATVADAAAITGNSAASGGGVYSDNAANTLAAPAGSITGNTPDNCAGLGISC